MKECKEGESGSMSGESLSGLAFHTKTVPFLLLSQGSGRGLLCLLEVSLILATHEQGTPPTMSSPVCRLLGWGR